MSRNYCKAAHARGLSDLGVLALWLAVLVTVSGCYTPTLMYNPQTGELVNCGDRFEGKGTPLADIDRCVYRHKAKGFVVDRQPRSYWEYAFKPITGPYGD